MTKTELYANIFVNLQHKQEIQTTDEPMKEDITRTTFFNEITPSDLLTEEHAIAFGAMMLCKSGHADIRINFGQWLLTKDSFICFYPNDIAQWKNVSDDFLAEVVIYSPEVLRAASMNIEHEIYRELRDDRLCSNNDLIQNMVKGLFDMFRFYHTNTFFKSKDNITTHLIQAFFMGFADFTRHNPNQAHTHPEESPRNRQLFARFMQLIEEKYKESNEVAYYAERMNISSKYLGKIALMHTGLTAKHIINDYRVQQLKLALVTTTQSLKEISLAFHFTDQSAFTRYFKAHTGKTPKAYRK